MSIFSKVVNLILFKIHCEKLADIRKAFFSPVNLNLCHKFKWNFCFSLSAFYKNKKQFFFFQIFELKWTSFFCNFFFSFFLTLLQPLLLSLSVLNLLYILRFFSPYPLKRKNVRCETKASIIKMARKMERISKHRKGMQNFVSSF